MSRLQRVSTALEWPLAFLALLVVPALILEERAVSPALRQVAAALNWAIWIGFCLDFAIRWAIDRQWSFFRRGWFDLALIILTPPFLVPESLQSARSLRALRLLRLLRAGAMVGIGLRSARRSFGARKFHLVALFAIGTIVLGAAGVFLFEAGQNRSIGNFGDALWWAMVTATTVGYGDVSPVTVEGRLIAVALMLTGIGVIGIFTATVASFFFEQQAVEDAQTEEIIRRLTAIEERLDAIAERVRNGHS